MKLWIAGNMLGMLQAGKVPSLCRAWGGSSTKAGKHFLPEPRGIRSSTHSELPVWALQLSLMIYFKPIPAGGDRWLWVICVLNISRIHRERFSWVIDWWVTPMSYGAQLVYRFELNHTHTCIVSNPFLRICSYYLFPLQSAIQLKLSTWQKIWITHWGYFFFWDF